MSADHFETDIIPIQLREDLTVYIAKLPTDLTRLEAEKICRVIMAFAGDTPARKSIKGETS